MYGWRSSPNTFQTTGLTRSFPRTLRNVRKECFACGSVVQANHFLAQARLRRACARKKRSFRPARGKSGRIRKHGGSYRTRPVKEDLIGLNQRQCEWFWHIKNCDPILLDSVDSLRICYPSCIEAIPPILMKGAVAMTLTAHYPVARIHGRTRHRSAVDQLPPPTLRQLTTTEYRVIPLRTRYCAAAWTCDDVNVPSTLIQALTMGVWLGRILEIGTTVMAALGMGWLLRRMQRKPQR
jgi:hypothetical protein